MHHSRRHLPTGKGKALPASQAAQDAQVTNVLKQRAKEGPAREKQHHGFALSMMSGPGRAGFAPTHPLLPLAPQTWGHNKARACNHAVKPGRVHGGIPVYVQVRGVLKAFWNKKKPKYNGHCAQPNLLFLDITVLVIVPQES